MLDRRHVIPDEEAYRMTMHDRLFISLKLYHEQKLSIEELQTHVLALDKSSILKYEDSCLLIIAGNVSNQSYIAKTHCKVLLNNFFSITLSDKFSAELFDTLTSPMYWSSSKLPPSQAETAQDKMIRELAQYHPELYLQLNQQARLNQASLAEASLFARQAPAPTSNPIRTTPSNQYPSGLLVT